jgi:hypothetical protein
MKHKQLKSLTAVAMLACMVAPSFAADDHKDHDHGDKKGAGHAHEDKARFGGVVAVVKDVNYELVAKPDSLTLYVTDHGKAVDLKGATAKVLLLSASDKSEAALAPAGDKFEAKGAFKVAAGTKAVATVTLPNKPAVTAKFTFK